MEAQQVYGLMEAYSSIYAPVAEYQESHEVSEEVIIASQYFCEMGLNEEGVEILIEELGLDDFSDFVYSIAEEYYLTEARARGERIEPKLSSGKPIQGKPKAASLKALRKKKAARQEAEQKASEAKPSGLKSSLKRQSAIAAAAKKQPKKKGFLDRVVDTVDAGIKRHNAANKGLSKAASEVGGLLSNVGRRVGGVAREFGAGASGTARLAGHLAKKGVSEEVEEWVYTLIDEGYDLSDYTWDDMCEMYLSEKEEPITPRRREKIKKQIGKKLSSDKPEDWEHAGYMSDRHGIKIKESYHEYVLNYLIDEGYANDIDSALVIAENMSVDWEQSILEGTLSAKAARAGEDIGKPGKMFSKIANEAGSRYGSEESGKRVAGSVLAKMRAKASK